MKLIKDFVTQGVTKSVPVRELGAGSRTRQEAPMMVCTDSMDQMCEGMFSMTRRTL
jgi:hypothetical protein